MKTKKKMAVYDEFVNSLEGEQFLVAKAMRDDLEKALDELYHYESHLYEPDFEI